MRKTKIVCTLGPATDDPKVLQELMRSGMNVARLNFSHGTYEDHQKRIDLFKKVRDELGLPVALMLDTKGPEIRIKTFEGDTAELTQGSPFTLTCDEVTGDSSKVSISCDSLKSKLSPGTSIFVDDGSIQLKVDKVECNDIVCTVMVGGKLSNRKSINVPDVKLGLTYMSERDMQDIKFGIQNDVDFIAASFVRCAADVLDVRKVLEENGAGDIHIIAKIENNEGVENIDEILKASDGIMVARGDMGVEIPFEELPRIQKLLIKKAYMSGKKAITATQMLESMIKNPRPTRAEVTDVANAIYDGTSAIMLSGETAVGAYPVLAVQTMCKIAERTENDINYQRRFHDYDGKATMVNDAISHATVTTAHDLGAAAIITVTKTGTTARMISKYRPACPIIGCSPSEKTLRQLAMSWGVEPLLIEERTNTDELFGHAVDSASNAGLVSSGDIVAITCGVPLGIPGTTNLLKVHIVGNVLVTGIGVGDKSAIGKLCVAASEQEALETFEDGDILVIPETSNSIIRLLKKAKGIITEAEGMSSHAAVVGLSLGIPVICSAKYATKILKFGTIVTMDEKSGLVYYGEMNHLKR